MDVRRRPRVVLVGLAVFVVAACSQKTSSSVFPENSQNVSACGATRIENRFIVQWENGITTIATAENKELFIKRVLEPRLADIRHVEFDKRVYIQQSIGAEASVALASTSDPTTWGQTIIEAPSAWNLGIQGQGIKVAVVDAAVDYSHPQLAPRLSLNLAEKSGAPGFDDDMNGLIDDVYGWDFYVGQPQPAVSSSNVHGSHVAGIILADHATGSMAGVAPKSELIPANFMDQAGGGNLGDAILAINYAASRGAKVINASWGGSFCSAALRDVIGSLASKNILFVAAAGNDGLDLDLDPEFPAAFDLAPQITVGATRTSDRLAAFSNTSYHLVHLAAPGDPIYSTVPGGYQYLSGTSMATPFVSGAAALLWSAKPNATVSQIKSALMNSVDVKDYRVMTRGRLNVRKALDEIKRLVQ